jgi:hypothetical protein
MDYQNQVQQINQTIYQIPIEKYNGCKTTMVFEQLHFILKDKKI